ncbi:HAD family hydrolase [Nocardioides allogilvus]|uniref:HAD family hydrolase n=1 Tax=Nocardioides allogilvus TaxID=2072017 RepID=UPI000D3073C0|nr:HAD family hydrolase [Nocardioides allogilvus]
MRAVIFDLDDTLVDHTSAARTACVQWARGQGLAGTDDELAVRWAAIATPHYERYQQREITFAEQRRARVREFLPHLDLAIDEAADEAFQGYAEAYHASWACFADAVPALRRVRGAGLLAAVLTNGDHAHQRLKLARVGLIDEVDQVFTSDEFPFGKPDPAPFIGTCARLGVDPAEALMVGDSLVADVQGAVGAGLHALLLDRRDAHPSHSPRISSLEELRFSTDVR